MRLRQPRNERKNAARWDVRGGRGWPERGARRSRAKQAAASVRDDRRPVMSNRVLSMAGVESETREARPRRPRDWLVDCARLSVRP